MAARFEVGDPDRPKGHALLYFRSTGGDEVLATYIVVLPIAINPAKYIPPAFAAGMQHAVHEVGATALPPIPEGYESVEAVRRLAEFRGDDLLDGGLTEPAPERLMLATHEIAQEYAARYEAGLAVQPPPDQLTIETPDEDTLRWMLMSEKERVGELAKLTGQLRYAVDGADERLRDETAGQIERLSHQLPEKYRLAEFLRAAQRPGPTGSRLAELYIDRCYRLSNEEYETLAKVDREIADLEAKTGE
jgi:hypothetical protein